MTRLELAMRIARECTSVAARGWGSRCVWCAAQIDSGEERGWIPLRGAVHVDCLLECCEAADAELRGQRGSAP